LLLINRPAGNSGLAKAAIEICAKIEHPLGSLRQAAETLGATIDKDNETTFIHNFFFDFFRLW
jgi:hypothetical protein